MSPRKKNLKTKLHEIIFEADTFQGKFFDIALLAAILISVLVVMLESVQSLHEKYHTLFIILEWSFTILFTAEYIIRIWITKKHWKYILSFYGIIDFLSILPTYMAIIITGSQSLMIIRILRLLRVFRILKLVRFLGEAQSLMNALKASRAKIIVFIFSVLSLTVVMGTIMYIVEQGENGFTSIPRSIYWAIVTLTTVGYGDIAPQTILGQTLASIIMILGYGIIAVPTGIVGAEVAFRKKEDFTTKACPSCSAEGHDIDAKFCKFCGGGLG